MAGNRVPGRLHRPSPPLICGFIDQMRADGHGVESICGTLRGQGPTVSPRAYRSWKSKPAPDPGRDRRGAHRQAARGHGRRPGRRPLPEVLYGRRKMTAWLGRNGFPGVSKHTVDRLMRLEGMNGLVRGRKTRTTIQAKGGVRAGDLLDRCFSAPRPNNAWVTDFTYVATWSGFVYVAFAIDLYSRAIVGWSASTVKDVAFVEACKKMALWRRARCGRSVPGGMIHHSDAARADSIGRRNTGLLM